MSRKMDKDLLLRHAGDVFAEAVFRFAANQLKSYQDAQDIVQEVLIAPYLTDKVFENDYHLKAWMMKATLYKCSNHKRDQVRIKEDSKDFSSPEVSNLFPSETEELISEKGRDPLWDIVDQLSEDFRTAIYLHYMEGCSVDEIAKIAECSPTTVRTRLFRARSKIKQALEGGAL